MAGFQRVTICGNVGKDPEVKKFDWGTVAEFSIATSETWKDKSTGEKKERTEWHKIKVNNKGMVENVVAPYVKKGSTILIEGKLQTREYEKDGSKRYITEVVIGPYDGSLTLMGSPKAKSTSEEPAAAATHKGFDAQGDVAQPAQGGLAGIDDEIPF